MKYLLIHFSSGGISNRSIVSIAHIVQKISNPLTEMIQYCFKKEPSLHSQCSFTEQHTRLIILPYRVMSNSWDTPTQLGPCCDPGICCLRVLSALCTFSIYFSFSFFSHHVLQPLQMLIPSSNWTGRHIAILLFCSAKISPED